MGYDDDDNDGKQLNLPFPDVRLIAPSMLAAYLKVSNITLDRMRQRGEGPPFIKIGSRKIMYRWTDVQSWLTSQTFTSTKAAKDKEHDNKTNH